MNTASFKRYLCEFIGAFLLAFGVGVSIAVHGFPVPTILVAGLVLGTAVYTIGAISGAHINPAVTVSLLSIGKIKPKDAVLYIIAQLLAGLVAAWLLQTFVGSTGVVAVDSSKAAIGEILGAFVLVWGVCSVVMGKVEDSASGLTIGASLSIGVIVASSASLGVINPAVAVGIGAVSIVYLLAPVVGGILAAQLYKWTVSK
jgi:aquaporin Z